MIGHTVSRCLEIRAGHRCTHDTRMDASIIHRATIDHGGHVRVSLSMYIAHGVQQGDIATYRSLSSSELSE